MKVDRRSGFQFNKYDKRNGVALCFKCAEKLCGSIEKVPDDKPTEHPTYLQMIEILNMESDIVPEYDKAIVPVDEEAWKKRRIEMESNNDAIKSCSVEEGPLLKACNQDTYLMASVKEGMNHNITEHFELIRKVEKLERKLSLLKKRKREVEKEFIEGQETALHMATTALDVANLFLPTKATIATDPSLEDKALPQ